MILICCYAKKWYELYMYSYEYVRVQSCRALSTAVATCRESSIILFLQRYPGM